MKRFIIFLGILLVSTLTYKIAVIALDNEITIGNPNNQDSSIASYPISYTNVKGRYINKKYLLQFDYQDNWKLVDEGDSIGLVPKSFCSDKCYSEVVSFIKVNLPDSETQKIGIKGVHLATFGPGYIKENSFMVNGNKIFKTEYKKDHLYDICYTIFHNGRYIQVQFREKDELGDDFSNYSSDVDSIINSIIFN